MNRVVSFDGTSSGSAALSRRSAVLRLGSGGLAALLASSAIPAAAQEASPMAGTPAAGQAYLAIRQYQLAPGHTMEELVATVGSGLVPILQQVPGFQEHFLVETSEGCSRSASLPIRPERRSRRGGRPTGCSRT